MDGYALNTPDGSFSINDIPLQFIDRIEIYKGIVPPEFGGDGLGSAIKVVTIDAEHGYYDLSYSYQSYGVHNPTACISHYFDKANMAFTLFAGGTFARNDYTITSPYVSDLKIKRDHDRLKMGEFGATLSFRIITSTRPSWNLSGITVIKKPRVYKRISVMPGQKSGQPV